VDRDRNRKYGIGLALHTGPSAHRNSRNYASASAVDAIEPRDEIVTFVDADTLPAPEWLARLVAALVNTGRDTVTGYRHRTHTPSNRIRPCGESRPPGLF
jgi:cellulose synthase/poly-beta-1,6-N-acetylglucosamine synthase-like glycosyltransferase